MSAQSGEGTRETGLHAELEALRREVAELRARRVIAATPSRAAAPTDDGGEMTMTDELKTILEELAESVEQGVAKRPVAYLLGALVAGILIGRMLSR